MKRLQEVHDGSRKSNESVTKDPEVTGVALLPEANQGASCTTTLERILAILTVVIDTREIIC